MGATCSHYVEDPAICDDVGEPKGQCANCGEKWYDHDMTSTEYKSIREKLGLTQAALAARWVSRGKPSTLARTARKSRKRPVSQSCLFLPRTIKAGHNASSVAGSADEKDHEKQMRPASRPPPGSRARHPRSRSPRHRRAPRRPAAPRRGSLAPPRACPALVGSKAPVSKRRSAARAASRSPRGVGAGPPLPGVSPWPGPCGRRGFWGAGPSGFATSPPRSSCRGRIRRLRRPIVELPAPPCSPRF